jgi:hypothetical protein
MPEAKKERYRRIRGAILKLLAYEHPKWIDQKVLYFLLDDLSMTISEEEFESHLAYLEERGLVKIEKRKAGKVGVSMILISSEGLDVLDGFKPDVGIDTRF